MADDCIGNFCGACCGVCCVGCSASISTYLDFVKCGSSGMGSQQRGCCNSCCQGSLEDDQFEKDARKRRLRLQQKAEAMVDAQPPPVKDMTSSITPAIQTTQDSPS